MRLAGNITRRDIVKTVGAAGAVGLAGCIGDDDSDGGGDDDGGDADDSDDSTDEPLGDRVPEVTLLYLTGLGSVSTTAEAIVPIIQESADKLGVAVQGEGFQIGTWIQDAAADARTFDMSIIAVAANPSLYEPFNLLADYHITRAGADPEHSFGNYANCEYTDASMQQLRAASSDEREELVNEAINTMGSDYHLASVHPLVPSSAYVNDLVEPGDTPFNFYAPSSVITTTPTDDDTVRSRVQSTMIASANHLKAASPTGYNIWCHYVNSPLVEYDAEGELRNMLASSIEESNEGRRFTVSLKDATFHNGDSVTAEDVQFTFEFIQNNLDTYTAANDLPLDSVDIVDDSTVEFNLTEVYRPIKSISFQRWGIIHKQSWEEGGVRENLTSYEPDPIIGSGPYEVSNFEKQSSLQLTPHDGHPMYSPEYDVSLIAIDGSQAIMQGLQNGDIDVTYGLAPAAVETLNQQMGDGVTIETEEKHSGYNLIYQYAPAPTKFPEFRQALGMVLDRQKIHQVAFRGKGQIDFAATNFMPTHPWRPDDVPTFTDQPTGDVEGARQVLEDAGWGWDDDGDLHYPPDADLSPRWPEGEVPTNEDGFDCVDAEGDYVPPGER